MYASVERYESVSVSVSEKLVPCELCRLLMYATEQFKGLVLK